ncbi:MAG: DUF1385 domain-containing protein [Chloroflexota bacterium]
MASFYYGGQAVIEGVMMRGRHQATVAVRRPGGDVVTHSELLSGALYRRPLSRLPFFRGLVALWEMLILGTRMLLFSANVQAKGQLGKEVPKRVVAVMLAFSLTFAIGLFFVLPLLLTRAGGSGHSSLFSNALEGAIRLGLFIAYLSLIGRLPRVRSVFQYHGAEHKTINAFEHGADLTPESVQRFSIVHVRCGTAFLLWVVVLSIFVFALVGHPPLVYGILSRVVLVPVIAACSYELLRLGARFYHIGVVRAVVQPGLWLQRLTTREPSEDQVAVAIAALQPVLRADGLLPEGSPVVRAGGLGLVRS